MKASRASSDRNRRSRGQSLVEFALVFPVVLLVIVGLMDFGRAIYANNSISNVARTAARVAAVDQDSAAINAAARDEAVGIDPLTITHTACFEMDCMYSVTVEHAFDPATPLIEALVGPITLRSTSSMPVEYENP